MTPLKTEDEPCRCSSFVISVRRVSRSQVDGRVWLARPAHKSYLTFRVVGRGQVVKAPGFDPGIRGFESHRPCHRGRTLYGQTIR